MDRMVPELQTMLNGWINAGGNPSLTALLISLITWLGIWIALFARRYMTGTTKLHRFWIASGVLFASLITACTADTIPIFAIAWILSYLMLIQLMVPPGSWEAARQSAWLSARYLIAGLGCILVGLSLLAYHTQSLSIATIIRTDIAEIQAPHSFGTELWIGIGLGMVGLGACILSGLWPFHRWLLSSLNSPTPVSAMMHAGLINGGGFLLARFAPLYLQYPSLLHGLFLMGFVSASLGTIWKLIQTDNKRFLACSTLAQMGMMIAQCGLGLFAAAITHLCWHGLFKAYLFLSSGQAATPPTRAPGQPPSIPVFFLAISIGIGGSALFARCAGEPWLATDTSLMGITIAGIGSAQVLLTAWAAGLRGIRGIWAMGAGLLFGACYGWSVGLVQHLLLPADLFVPQPWTPWHTLAWLCLVTGWLLMVWRARLPLHTPQGKQLWAAWYVRQLNASQPDPRTVTPVRSGYRLDPPVCENG